MTDDIWTIAHQNRLDYLEKLWTISRASELESLERESLLLRAKLATTWERLQESRAAEATLREAAQAMAWALKQLKQRERKGRK